MTELQYIEDSEPVCRRIKPVMCTDDCIEGCWLLANCGWNDRI